MRNMTQGSIKYVKVVYFRNSHLIHFFQQNNLGLSLIYALLSMLIQLIGNY